MVAERTQGGGTLLRKWKEVCERRVDSEHSWDNL
jgi:hypothetical protein